MDLSGTIYVQEAEASATVEVPAVEGDASKLTPSKDAGLMEFEGQVVGLGGGADGAPRHGSCQSNGAALVGVDVGQWLPSSDKAMVGYLTCPAEPGTDLVSAGMKLNEAPPLEGLLPMRWAVTGRRGRPPTGIYAGCTPTAPYARSSPAALLQSSCSDEEEAAMILFYMSTGGATLKGLEPEQEMHMQLIHAPDAVEGHQMPGLEQLVPEADVEHTMTPDDAAGAVVEKGKHVWEAEKPVEVEPISKVVMVVEQALPLEHVAIITAAQEVEMPAEVEPVEHAVRVAVRKNKRPVSSAAKTPKKRRQQLVGSETPPNPTPAAEAAGVEPPVWRIVPASDRTYVCHHCSKLFTTHQALGGHMAYHNKVRKFSGKQRFDGRFAAAQAYHNIMAQHQQRQVGGRINVPIPRAAGGEEVRGLPPPLPAAKAPLLHPCSRCNMVFRTGQALGGHMRKHSIISKQLAEGREAAVATASATALAAAARPSAAASRLSARSSAAALVAALSARPSVVVLPAASRPSVAASRLSVRPSAVVLPAASTPSDVAAEPSAAGPRAVPRNFDLNKLPWE